MDKLNIEKITVYSSDFITMNHFKDWLHLVLDINPKDYKDINFIVIFKDFSFEIF